MRIVPVVALLAFLASCKSALEDSTSRGGGRATVVPEDTATKFRDLKPIPLGVERFRVTGGDSLVVTCSPAAHLQAGQALGGSRTAWKVALPDTGCLLWIVLKTAPSMPTDIIPDSITLAADTAILFARLDVNKGPPSSALVRPGVVLQSPRKVGHVRLELRTYDIQAGKLRLPQ